MSDFETHSLGTSTELRLSRVLSSAIAQNIEQWGRGIMPSDVLSAYERLKAHYDEQIGSGIS